MSDGPETNELSTVKFAEKGNTLYDFDVPENALGDCRPEEFGEYSVSEKLLKSNDEKI